mgnify:FL=1
MPRSPRFLRPHTVQLIHKLGEDDNLERIEEVITLNHVKFDDNENLSQSNTGKEQNTSSALVIDCNDLHAKKNAMKCRYLSNSKYKNQDGYFSISVGDIIKYECKEYVVNGVNEVNPFGRKIEFIEVSCNG